MQMIGRWALIVAISMSLVEDGGWAQDISPNPQSAIRNPQSAIRNPQSRNPPSSIDRAKQLLEAGSIHQAVALLREIVQKEPANADAHILLGTALALVPERSPAIEALRRAVQLRPAFAPAHYTLGTVLARFAELDAAKVSFEKAIELDPHLADAHVSLALVLAQRKEFASARAHFSEAAKLQGDAPAAASTHYWLAQTWVAENEPQKALRALDAAIKLRSDYADAYLSRGMVQRLVGDTPLDESEALQSFQRAVELSPDNAAAQYQLGVAYLRSGRPAQAVAHLQTSLTLKPEDRSALFQLCQALHQAGQAEEATTCRQQLSAMSQTERAANDNMEAAKLNNEGVELEKAGNVAAALDKYRRAVELDPSRTVFRRNLALALCRLGRWEEGVAELKAVLKADPDDVKATKALYIALEKAKAANEAGSANGKPQPKPK